MLKNPFGNGQIELSCEVFPPKRDDDMYTVFQALDDISTMEPDFISVTYGAGGSNSRRMTTIAAYIQNINEVTSLAHLTAVGLTPEGLQEILTELERKNVHRILCLRGDQPRSMTREEFNRRHYQHAADLITEVKKHGGFRIAAACYPEGHPESPDEDTDIRHLREKCDCGADELITQMFFDNEKFYRFQEKLEKAGVQVPVHAGIMPITNSHMLGTSVSLSGSSVPHDLSEMLARYAEQPEDLYKAGIEYAVRQCEDLMRHGIYGIHLYSMNKAKVARDIFRALFGES